MLSSEKPRERTYDELNVRGETGLGAEVAGDGAAAPAPAGAERQPVGAAST